MDPGPLLGTLGMQRELKPSTASPFQDTMCAHTFTSRGNVEPPIQLLAKTREEHVTHMKQHRYPLYQNAILVAKMVFKNLPFPRLMGK